MPHLNFECKVKVSAYFNFEEKLKKLNPKFIGEDHQIDTYFNANVGRLKLREGNIENALIQYERENTEAAKTSKVILYQHKPNADLKAILTYQLGIKIIVDKLRKIYFIDNVKFHFDAVKNLGEFIEIEAIDADGTIGLDKLKEQCMFYINYLGIEDNKFIAESYSDLLLALK